MLRFQDVAGAAAYIGLACDMQRKQDELLAPGVISSTYISGLARAERGAWPLGVADLYGIDDAHLTLYAKAARTREGFEKYLDEFVWQSRKSSLPA